MNILLIRLLSASLVLGEYVVKLPSGPSIAISVKGRSAFRIRLASESSSNPLVRPLCSADSLVDHQCTSDADYTVVEDYATGRMGISTTFGAVQVDRAGILTLYDRNNKLLTASQPLGNDGANCMGVPHLDQKGGTRIGTTLYVEDQCACQRVCMKTNGCEAWVFDVSPPALLSFDGKKIPFNIRVPSLMSSENRGKHRCWLMKNVVSWQVAYESRVSGVLRGTLHFSTKADEARLYGGGAGMSDAIQLAKSASTGAVINEATYTSYYYSVTDGYGALGVSSETRLNRLPVAYGSKWGRVSWLFDGDFDLFLLPAETLEEGTVAFYDLVGRPAVPPLYAFGFIASRWGWQDSKYITAVLSQFRSGRYPIDAFITDFEWFTDHTDYNFKPRGEPNYDDFGWNPDTFPDPKAQLSAYHSALNVKMGGIRKPRMGNTSTLEFLKSKGWILGGPGEGGEPEGYAKGRGVNYSIPDARRWYGRQMSHYLDEGVDFWWNDEGEDDYYNFYWWNVAQLELLRTRNASKRFFSINRAFSPGMARFGAAFWTGDVHATWEDLKKTPGMVLNWNLGGAPFTGCDTGGFLGTPSPEMLVRWYQVSAFLPIMRVHSTVQVTPHWPWLWGSAAAGALRQALNLRYRMIPYHYTLAKTFHSTGKVYMRPMVMDFPDSVVTREILTQWMFGQILVAPVLNEYSHRAVYLPEGIWYTFNDTSTTLGPKSISGTASLDEVPMYVQPGTIVVVGCLVQHTTELPGGPLEVQVYSGRDASFDFYEDDGETINFADERKVTFWWDNINFKLSWRAIGKVFPHSFDLLTVSVFEPGEKVRRTQVYAIGSAGTVDLSRAGRNIVYM